LLNPSGCRDARTKKRRPGIFRAALVKKKSAKKEQADYRTPWRRNTGKVTESPGELARHPNRRRNTEEQGLWPHRKTRPGCDAEPLPAVGLRLAAGRQTTALRANRRRVDRVDL